MLTISFAGSRELPANLKALSATIQQLVDNDYLVTLKDQEAFTKGLFEFGCRRMNISKEVRVNKPWDEAALCVYIVGQRRDTTKKLSGDALTLIRRLPRNFLALPPNVIVIDALFLDYLALSGWAAFTSGTRMLEEKRTDGNKAARDSLKIFDFTDDLAVEYLDGDSVKAGKFLSENPLAEKLLKLYVLNQHFRFRQLEGMRSDHPEHIYFRMGAMEVYRGSRAKMLLQPYLALMVFHELAHLTVPGAAVVGWNTIEDLLRRTSPAYNEEMRADSLAVETMREYIGSDSTGPVSKSQKEFALLEFCGTLRDMLLHRVYEGFHGFSARDLFFTLEHKDQAQIEEITSTEGYLDNYPYYSITGFNFGNPDFLNRAYINSPPAMTREEYAGIKRRLEEESRSLTHRHLLKRARTFFELLDKEFQDFEPRYFHGLDQLYDISSLDQRDASLLDVSNHPFGRVTGLQGLGISVSKVLARVGSQFRIEVGVPLHGTGSLICRGNGIYMELWGDTANVSKVVIVKRRLETSEAVTDDVMADLAVFLRLVSTISPYFETHLDFFLGEYAALLQAEFHTKRYVNNDVLLTLSWLNESPDAIRITASSTKNFPFLANPP